LFAMKSLLRSHCPLFVFLMVLLASAGCIKEPTPQPTVVMADWKDIPGWEDDNHAQALAAFRASCQVLQRRAGWQVPCWVAQVINEDNPEQVSTFFEAYFNPYRLQDVTGDDEGLITGYYVPDLRGSRNRTEAYPYPVYGRPDDLLVIDLDDVYPDLGNYRLRGRLQGNRVVPYWDRRGIDSGEGDLAGNELFWVADPVELFFLHIQGSGQIVLPDGNRVMLNYADQNGHPYRSIGKLLLDRGFMTRSEMSMQNIQRWAMNNPDLAPDLLAENPSYVFFRELDGRYQSPPGALGVPLTPERSIAVDPRRIPLGAPVYLSTTRPGNSGEPYQRLMVAQDTGGAIKGPVRADLFWGMGDAAGELAGRMKHPGRLWLLLPEGVSPPGT